MHTTSETRTLELLTSKDQIYKYKFKIPGWVDCDVMMHDLKYFQVLKGTHFSKTDVTSFRR